MNQAKKVVALILILALLFNIVVLASVPVDVANTNYEKKVEFLLDLGIFNTYSDGDFKPDNIVTRTEFAIIISKMLGSYSENTLLEDSNSTFIDVEPEYYAAKSIMFVNSLGLMTGYEDGTFRGSEPIYYEQAIKVMVNILGYSLFAERKGGYPSGYIIEGNDINIDKGVNFQHGLPMSRGSVAQLVYNSLNTEILQHTSFGTDDKYSVVPGETFLMKKLDVYKVRGKITATSKFNLSLTNETLPNNRVTIDNEIYITGNTNASNMLGYVVNAYYKQDKTTDDKTLVSVSVENTQDERLVINFEDIVSYSEHILLYKKNDHIIDVNIPSTADIIYNGGIVSAQNREIALNPDAGKLKDGNMELVKYDGVIGLVKVTSYENYIVQNIDKDEYKIYDKYDAHKFLVLDNEESSVSIKNSKGKVLYFDSIFIGTVLNVAKSLEGKKVDIIICDKEFEGVVDEIREDGTKKKLLIGGEEYAVANNYIQSGEGLPTVGNKYSFYLDSHGKIADISKDNSGYIFGYLVGAIIEPKGVRKTLQFKIYNQKGEFLYCNGNDKIILDNDPIRDNNIIITRLQTTHTKGTISQPIRYKLNSNNEIAEIDTVFLNEEKGESSDSLRATFSTATGLTYKSVGRHFMNKVIISNSTRVLSVAEDPNASNDLYTIKPITYFVSDSTYIVNSYSFKKNGIEADALIIYASGNPSITTARDYSVVKSIKSAVNSAGESVQKVICLTNRVEETLFTTQPNMLDSVKSMNVSDTNTYKLEAGDVIKYSLDELGRINAAQLVFDASELAMKVANPTATATAQTRLIYANVYNKSGSLLAITTMPASDLSYVNITADVELHDASLYTIYSFNSKNKSISAISSSDINDYVHTLNNFSKVLVFTRWGEPRVMVVYK